MHVLHAIAAARRGGAEQLLLLVGRDLQRLGTRVSILFFDDGPLRASFEAAGLSCHVLGGQGIVRATRLARARRLVADLAPDVVHPHGLRALGHLGPLARIAGVPVVYASHAVSAVKRVEYGRFGRAYCAIEAWSIRRFASAVVATSEAMQRDLGSPAHLGGVPVHVIPPCIDLDRFPQVTPDARAQARQRFGVDGLVVGAVGRLIKAKGHAVAIRALTLVPDATLVIAGDGPERAALTALARDLGVHDRLRLLGDTSDVAGVCHASDVVVYPSTEGIIGLAALEAMACGVPVVASNQPGVTTFVEPGVTAELATPGDAGALAAAISALRAYAGHAARIAAAGAAVARARYAPAVAASRHQAVYDAVVGDALR